MRRLVFCYRYCVSGNADASCRCYFRYSAGINTVTLVALFSSLARWFVQSHVTIIISWCRSCSSCWIRYKNSFWCNKGSGVSSPLVNALRILKGLKYSTILNLVDHWMSLLLVVTKIFSVNSTLQCSNQLSLFNQNS